MATDISTVNIDQLIASVMPYAIPVLVLLIGLGILFFFLRNLKWILIIGLLGLIYLAITGGKVDLGKIDIGKLDLGVDQTNASMKEFRLSELAIGKDMENGVVPDDRVLNKNDPALFVGFEYENAEVGKGITTILAYMQKNAEISKKEGELSAGNGYYATSFPMPNEGWKVGTYSISIYYEENKISESAFQVVD